MLLEDGTNIVFSTQSLSANRRTEDNQNFLDYLYNDWSFADRFSHPQYDSEINTTIVSPQLDATTNTTYTTNTTKDEKAKLVKYQVTKYALHLFKAMANRSFEMSHLDLKKDLNYTEGQNLNEFIVKWYLKVINNTRGDIFLTKVKGNVKVDIRGKELNNLIIDLLNKKLSKNVTHATKPTEATKAPLDETLRNLKQIKQDINKENVEKKNKLKIDINKLNTSNYEYLMLKKIKENFKNKKYDDPYINLSDIDREYNPNAEKRPYQGRQYPPTPKNPGIDPMVFPHPAEYPPIPGRPVHPPNPGEYPSLPVHPGTIYPPPNPEVHGAFPSPEEMGIELRPGEPGYTGSGIPGPQHGPRWTPPMPHFGPPGPTPKPLPGEEPKPTRPLPPSVHGDPERPFGSLLHQNPRPVTTTEDPFLRGLLQDMQTQKNGYLTTFFIKLFELIAVKRKEYARLLIHRLEPVMTRLYDQRQLLTFGEPLTTKLLDLSRLMNSAPADVAQSHAATAHYALTHRKTYLSPEINGIIEYADSLYNDIEGQNLLKTLQDVKLFPNTTKTAIEIGNEVLDEALLGPYRRMTGTHKIQVLFDSINNAIIRRFPGRRRNVDKQKIKDRRGNINIGDVSVNKKIKERLFIDNLGGNINLGNGKDSPRAKLCFTVL